MASSVSHHQYGWPDDRGIVHRRFGLLDLPQTLADALFGTRAMLVEECAYGFRRLLLQLRQSGPTLEKSGHDGGRQMIKPVQNLRKIQFQLVGDAVGLSRSFVHQLTAVLHQRLQRTSLLGVRPEDA